MARRWLLRIAAIAFGLAPFILFEFALFVFNLPKTSPHYDPFLDLSQTKPLFSESADGSLRIPEERQRLFAKVAFSRQKPINTKRIFALGGSTTQGEPYGPPTAFPEWLRINLQLIDPAHTYEVINCGGLSYASYRVLPILREVLEYNPDFILIYTGQNEFLEARELGGWRKIPDSVARVGSSATQLRTVQWLRGLIAHGSPENRNHPQTELQSEVDALLDYQGGLANYHRSNLDRTSVTASFRWNIEQMVVACRNQNIPVLFVVPTVNLKDSPPFKIEIDSQLIPALKEEVSKLWKEVETYHEAPDRALQNASRILTIDPEHAGSHYLIGQQALATRDWDKAKKHLLQAKEFDVCPLRATNGIQQTVRDVCNHRKIPYIDADQLFQSKSPNQIVGREWLVDHIHPTIEGHQLLGEVICNKLLEIGWLKSKQSISAESRPEAYRQHLSTLGEDYFIRGKQRLEGLLLWTQGRAKKLPITPLQTSP